MEQELKKEFEKIDQGFEKIDQRFVSLEKNLTKKIDEKIEKSALMTDEKIEKSALMTDEKIENLALMTKEGFDEMGKRIDKVEKKVDGMERKMDGMERKINRLPDKDYLVDKLGDLRGDLVILMRKEDQKVIRLVEILKEKNILVETEVEEILKMEPFPRHIL